MIAFIGIVPLELQMLRDLRVDWHEAPLFALRDLWERYEPQMDQFLLWALSPDKAPPIYSERLK